VGWALGPEQLPRRSYPLPSRSRPFRSRGRPPGSRAGAPPTDAPWGRPSRRSPWA